MAGKGQGSEGTGRKEGGREGRGERKGGIDRGGKVVFSLSTLWIC